MCFAPNRRTLFRHLNVSKVVRTCCCVYHFDLEMCFAPQRRALFRHRNFQKWSDVAVFCAFWIGNVLRTTTACTFSTSQLLRVFREWCSLYILTWKCASRHSGVQLFISHLASWLRTRRSSEPIFWTLLRHKSLEKHNESRLSYLFSHLHLLSSLSFFSLIFSPDSSHLCFSICPYCWKFDF